MTCKSSFSSVIMATCFLFFVSHAWAQVNNGTLSLDVADDLLTTFEDEPIALGITAWDDFADSIEVTVSVSEGAIVDADGNLHPAFTCTSGSGSSPFDEPSTWTITDPAMFSQACYLNVPHRANRDVLGMYFANGTPPASTGNEISITVSAQSIEDAITRNVTWPAPLSVLIKESVDGSIADAPATIDVKMGTSAIDFDLSFTMPDVDASETTSIQIAGFPSWATLNKGTETFPGSGVYHLNPAQLNGLQILLTNLETEDDFVLTVTLTTIEIDSMAFYNYTVQFPDESVSQLYGDALQQLENRIVTANTAFVSVQINDYPVFGLEFPDGSADGHTAGNAAGDTFTFQVVYYGPEMPGRKDLCIDLDNNAVYTACNQQSDNTAGGIFIFAAFVGLIPGFILPWRKKRKKEFTGILRIIILCGILIIAATIAGCSVDPGNDNQEVRETFEMTEADAADMDAADGKLYTVDVPLVSAGTFSYTFKFENQSGTPCPGDAAGELYITVAE